MKFRSCFVSNSSSCSFIVIGNSLNKDKLSLKPWKYGEKEFSYGNWSDSDSKLNFLMLQYCYNSDDSHMEKLLSDFCQKNGIDFDEYYDYMKYCVDYDGEKYPAAWIDHQSVIDNDYYSDLDWYNVYNVFDSEDSLERFVMDKDSILHMTRD